MRLQSEEQHQRMMENNMLTQGHLETQIKLMQNKYPNASTTQLQ